MSIDRVAAVNGESKWITKDDARRSAHLLRAKNDAILQVSTCYMTTQLDCRSPGLGGILQDVGRHKVWIPVTSHLR